MVWNPPAGVVPVDRKSPSAPTLGDIPAVLDWLRTYYPGGTVVGTFVTVRDQRTTYRVDGEPGYGTPGTLINYTLTQVDWNRGEVSQAVADANLALQQLNDQKAVVIAAASGTAIPVIHVHPVTELNATGYPNGFTAQDYNAETTWNVTGAAGATVLTYMAAGSAPIAQVGALAWAGNIRHDNGEYHEYTVIGFDATAGTITLNEPLRAAATNAALRNSHYQNNHRTESGTRALAHYVWRQDRRYTTARYSTAQFRADATSGPWVAIGGLTTGGNTAAGDAKGLQYNFTASVVDSGAPGLTQKITSSVGTKSLFLGMDLDGQGAEWTQGLTGVRGHLDAWIGCRRGTILIEVILGGQTVYSRQMGRGLTRVRVPFMDVAQGVLRVRQVGAAAATAKIGAVSWYSAVGAKTGRVIPLTGEIVVAGDSWTQFWNQAFSQELQALITAAGGTAQVFNVGNSGKTTRWATWWKPVWKAARPTATFIYLFGVNDNNGVATVEARPDGSTAAQGVVTLDEYRANLNALADDDLTDGRQPIIVHLSGAPVDSQHQARSLWLASFLPSIPLTAAASDTTYFKTLRGGGPSFNQPARYMSDEANAAASVGHLFDTGVNRTGGELLAVANFGAKKWSLGVNGETRTPAVYLGNGNNDGLWINGVQRLRERDGNLVLMGAGQVRLEGAAGTLVMGSWDRPFIIGAIHLWMEGGNLRKKYGAPVSAVDGTVIP